MVWVDIFNSLLISVYELNILINVFVFILNTLILTPLIFGVFLVLRFVFRILL